MHSIVQQKTCCVYLHVCMFLIGGEMAEPVRTKLGIQIQLDSGSALVKSRLRSQVFVAAKTAVGY